MTVAIVCSLCKQNASDVNPFIKLAECQDRFHLPCIQVFLETERQKTVAPTCPSCSCLFQFKTKSDQSLVDKTTIKTFKKILETQRDILQSDSDVYKAKAKIHNKKGYSRLYDITTQMFLSMAHDCLVNEQVSLNTKNNLNDLLQKQLELQIKMLRERLSGQAKFKALAEKIPDADEWLSGSVELKALKDFIKDHYDSVPKHLRYLLENINNLTQLKDAVPLRSHTLHRGRA